MLTLLLLGQAPTADAVLKRFDQFMSGVDTLSVAVKAKVNGRALGNGTIRIDKPNRFSISVITPGGVEKLIFSEEGAIELNQGTKFYSNHPLIGRLYIPALNVTGGLTYSIPRSLLAGNSQGLFPNELNPKVTPKVMINGVATDMVTGKQEGMGGSRELRANYDSAGRLLRFYSKSVGPQGTFLIEQEISNYVVNQKIPASTFSLTKPLGFSPFALDTADYGLQQGTALPNITLSSVGGQTASVKSLMSGKNSLLVVTDPEFHANAELFKSIQQISKRIPDFKLITISARRDAATARSFGANTYFDPTGLQLPKLLLPGSPAMYLVDKKGIVAQMFFGFDGQWTGLDKAIERLK